MRKAILVREHPEVVIGKPNADFQDLSLYDWAEVYPLVDGNGIVEELIDATDPPTAYEMQERGLVFDEAAEVYRLEPRR